MNKKRLLKLADLLEADARNKKGVKFDLNIWGMSEESDIAPSCGTTACAVGLAIASGAFKRAGLKNYHGERARIIFPEFDGQTGFDAVQKLFGIGMESADFLFCVDSYPRRKSHGAIGERYVAKRIRDFVAGKVSP